MEEIQELKCEKCGKGIIKLSGGASILLSSGTLIKCRYCGHKMTNNKLSGKANIKLSGGASTTFEC